MEGRRIKEERKTSKNETTTTNNKKLCPAVRRNKLRKTMVYNDCACGVLNRLNGEQKPSIMLGMLFKHQHQGARVVQQQQKVLLVVIIWMLCVVNTHRCQGGKLSKCLWHVCH
jgi:hypothetical protein